MQLTRFQPSGRALIGAALASIALLALNGSATAQVVVFQTDLNGSQAGTGSSGTGTGTLDLDLPAGTLTYDIHISGLSSPETGAHIRGPALPGTTGPIVLDLGVGSQKNGTWTLPPGEALALVSGLLYVCVETQANPSGEVRGQVTYKPVPYCFCPLSLAPCGNDDDLSGCANSDGNGAFLASLGQASIALDSLVLNLIDAPANKPLIFFGGPNPKNPPLPFGDGLLCLNAPIKRLPPLETTDNVGAASKGPGFLSTVSVQAGEVWCFQAWYRDPAGPCGRFFNLSNALQVQFTP